MDGNLEKRRETPPISHEMATRLKKESVCEQMAQMTISQSIEKWLSRLSHHTKRNYLSAMNRMAEEGVIDPNQTLQQFSLITHYEKINQIKQVSQWAETTKQARAACYMSFTRFLSRVTDGVFRRAEPIKEGHDQTFFRVHEKVQTNALNRSEWIGFFESLHKINPRDALIGKVMLQGARRACEVLSLNIDQLNFSTNEITFKISKTKGLEKVAIIRFPEPFLNELRAYIKDREEILFVTKTGSSVHYSQVHETFRMAGERAEIPFRVTPHVMRTSAITYLKSQEFSSDDILRVTGHSSGEMVNRYDKHDLSDNPMQKVDLI